MATDIFLKLGDIKGESPDSKHKDEIEIYTWSWGVSQPGSIAEGMGAGVGKATFTDIAFTHKLDKASATLWKYCSNGGHIKDGILTQRKAGGGQEDYLIIKMSDCMITSVSTSGSDGSEPPMETFTLQAAKIQMDYKPQKADGSLDSAVQYIYDIKLRKEG